MKIAYILPSLANKGPIIVVQNLANNLCVRGYHVDVYYFDAKFGTQFNCPTIKLEKKCMPDFDQYDIVHSHGYRPDKFLSKIKKNFVRAKAISTIHSHIERDLACTYNKFVSIFFSPLWFRCLKKMDIVITISHFLEKIYRDKISQLVTVYNGIDINVNIECADKQIVDKIQGLKNTYKIIGSYAYITSIKGLHQIINVLSTKRNWAMIIIGEGPEKANLEKLATRNNVADRVLFFPYLKNPYNYLPLFDVYALPSYSEGFGLALIEAVQAKVSVVCSNIAVFRELFNEEEVTFFMLDDMKSLFNAIDTTYTNRERLTENAYKKTMFNYTIHAMTDSYLNVYQKMM